jgi:hypothetical protein
MLGALENPPSVPFAAVEERLCEAWGPGTRLLRLTEQPLRSPHRGYHGRKTRLTGAAVTGDGIPREVDLVAKHQDAESSYERMVYLAVTARGAPTARYYGSVPTETGGALLVEHLPCPAVEPTSLAEHRERLALALAWLRTPVPPGWEPRLYSGPDIRLHLIWDVGDEDLRAWVWRHRDLLEIPAERLSRLLEIGDRLPLAVVHRDLSPQNTGRRTPGGPLLSFDLETVALGLRLMDVAQTTRHAPELIPEVAIALGAITNTVLTPLQIAAEAAVCDALAVLDGLPFALAALDSGASDMDLPAEEARAEHRQRIVAGLLRLTRVARDVDLLAARLGI